MEKEKTTYEILSAINVNEYVEKKNNLTYLSWAWAWDQFIRVCPNATYQIKWFEEKPYLYDDKLGYMVFTSINDGNGNTKFMWLPVMDGANKAMKDHPYKYQVKNWNTGQMIEKVCEAATMFDINKTLMRCLTKNIAMFGLGLYIYSGEDVPREEKEDRWEGLDGKKQSN